MSHETNTRCQFVDGQRESVLILESACSLPSRRVKEGILHWNNFLKFMSGVSKVWCFLKLCQSSPLMPPSQSPSLASPTQSSYLTTPPSQSSCIRPLGQATVIRTKKAAVGFFTPSSAYISIRTKVNQGNLWPLSNPFPHSVFQGSGCLACQTGGFRFNLWVSYSGERSHC